VSEYDWCAERDAEHDPRIALMQDPEMPPGYVTIECAACHQTTGVAFDMPAAEDIDW
jgi:hypothetical protein